MLLSIPERINYAGETVALVDYQPHVYVRLAVIAGIVIAIVGSLALSGKLPVSSLPTHASWQLLTGTIAPIVLIPGGAIVIYRARKYGVSSGQISGTAHWKLIPVKDDPSSTHMDFSSIENSRVRLYYKTQWYASLTGFLLALLTPLYTCFVIVYNILRCALIPLYLLVRIGQQRSGITLYPHQRPFAFMDIPRQMALSLARALQAPFYGTALFFAALKAIVDPLNGIKEGAGVEYDWNDQVPLREEGIWMAACKILPYWKWEGGGGPEKLGRNGFYAAGSWQPYSVELPPDFKVN
jgi:hypothetical protein